jgi:hypothetical protein
MEEIFGENCHLNAFFFTFLANFCIANEKMIIFLGNYLLANCRVAAFLPILDVSFGVYISIAFETATYICKKLKKKMPIPPPVEEGHRLTVVILSKAISKLLSVDEGRN